jgi:hypothetical protein
MAPTGYYESDPVRELDELKGNLKAVPCPFGSEFQRGARVMQRGEAGMDGRPWWMSQHRGSLHQMYDAWLSQQIHNVRNQPPGSLLSSQAVQTYRPAIDALRPKTLSPDDAGSALMIFLDKLLRGSA